MWMYKGLAGPMLCACLAGVSSAALAQANVVPPAEDPADQGGEITVTATRRATNIVDVPYNITAIGGQQLEQRGVTGFSDLMSKLPGVSYTDTGGGGQRAAGSSVIIRGVNASGAGSLAQAATGERPVSIFYGETPIFVQLPIVDINRVEVLRGPQGTLFGAGSLSGTMRFIPNAPKIGTFEGNVSGQIADVSHSGNADYQTSAVLNLPIGDVAALRVVGQYTHNAGFVDWNAAFARSSPDALGRPVLTDGLPTLSPVRDVNWSNDSFLRAALRVEPIDALDITLAYSRQRTRGNAAPEDNPEWAGGAPYAGADYSIPGSGEYQNPRASAQVPWHQDVDLYSADIDVDLGFATLTSNTSYTRINALSWIETTYGSAGQPWIPYYAGDPRFPALIMTSAFPDKEKHFNQDLRIVSQMDGPIDFIAGAYYAKSTVRSSQDIFVPGVPEWQDQVGSELPLGYVDRTRGEVGTLPRTQRVTTKALYGEATWHATPRLDLTGGIRYFHNSVSQDFLYDGPAFLIYLTNKTENKDDGFLFKANASYKLDDDNRVYATFSQGYRRGGANAFNIYEGAESYYIGELESLIPYKPDYLNNYEIGIKGRIARNLEYSAAIFYEQLKDTQIEARTPVQNFAVVVNGGKAVSRGAEFELHARHFVDRLSADLSFTYADAKLTEDFAVPTAEGEILGSDGDRLPGSAKVTMSAFLNYDTDITQNARLNVGFGANYRGSVVFALPNSLFPEPRSTGGAVTFNANMSVTSGPWNIGLFANNLTDKRMVTFYNPGAGRVASGSAASSFYINRPRTLGVKLGYNF